MDRMEELEKKIKALELKLIKKEKIQKVLMDRVEKSINSSGSAYTLFENNIILEETVEKRTEELRKANKGLLIEIENRRKVEREKKNLIRELQEALAEVKVLSGLLPICSFCKNIRNSEGYWQAIEMYIREHSAAEFTHGICEECMQKHFTNI
ncbi:MAG: hypothetical protein GY799_26055 [Desulfobulbaceae bacterium]|nr:hypothetical protein [Desulfobulbaceae bacterium]